MLSDKKAIQKLRREVEKGKIALSTSHQVRIEIENFHNGKDLSEVLTRAKFEELNQDLFKKLFGPITKVRKAARGFVHSAVPKLFPQKFKAFKIPRISIDRYETFL